MASVLLNGHNHPLRNDQSSNFAQQAANAWIEERRQKRAASHVTVWATSPLRPERSPSPEPKPKRRRRSLSDSSSSDESERDTRKRSSKHRSSKHTSSRRRKSRSPDGERRRRSKREDLVAAEDEWVEAAATPPDANALVRAPATMMRDDSEDEIGPMPAPHSVDKPISSKEFGQRLLKGEGEAMAAYVAEGARIPRRGEIGMEADDIDKYERAGFVMSGSRNKKMETVRTRKENQVISAEEKRSLLKMQKEEKVKREQDIIASFKEMVDKSLNPPPKPRPS